MAFEQEQFNMQCTLCYSPPTLNYHLLGVSELLAGNVLLYHEFLQAGVGGSPGLTQATG